MSVKTEKVEGTVEDVSFHNAENGFTVLDINSNGELITAVGTFFEIGAGEEVVLYGSWGNHSVFGRQFKVETYEAKLPDSAASLLRYLSSGMIRGVGPKTAKRIIERFGENSFQVLENDWERLTVIKGISKEKAAAISNEYKKQFSIRNVLSELDRYGIKAAECIRIFKKLGASCVGVIKRNPYVLCSEIRGFEFTRCEEIAGMLDETPEQFYRTEAGILYVMRHNLGNGHTCIPEDKLLPTAASFLSIDEETVSQELERLYEIKELVKETISDRDYVFLPHIYNSEKNAAERIHELLKFPPLPKNTMDRDIEAIENENAISYEEKQKTAIRTAAEKGAMILTGGPGTGKTTTVKGIIDFFEKQGLHVLLAAPTGRAAKRMSELTGKEAKTLHRLLEVVWSDEDEPEFTRDRRHPLDADAIIIDELSMVDITVFSALLNAVPFGCRLIMVGDTDQLPPVGAGNVLLDMANSGIIPVVRLTEIFRQARKSLIIMNSHRIVNGEYPMLDVKDNDFFFIERGSSLSSAALTAELVCKRLPAAYGYDPVQDIQVLCPSRKGDCGSVNINIRLQKLLNPPDDSKEEISSLGRVLRTGDKVMQIKNNYDIVWNKFGEEGTGIFNGDTGIITSISRRKNEMIIDFDGRETVYPLESLSELELAYAVTVHKSQGSEYPAVIIPIIDAPSQLMYRNLLYTAVTRAKNILILVGNRRKIELMVENNKKNRRYSALEYFLNAE